MFPLVHLTLLAHLERPFLKLSRELLAESGNNKFTQLLASKSRSTFDLYSLPLNIRMPAFGTLPVYLLQVSLPFLEFQEIITVLCNVEYCLFVRLSTVLNTHFVENVIMKMTTCQ